MKTFLCKVQCICRNLFLVWPKLLVQRLQNSMKIILLKVLILVGQTFADINVLYHEQIHKRDMILTKPLLN